LGMVGWVGRDLAERAKPLVSYKSAYFECENAAFLTDAIELRRPSLSSVARLAFDTVGFFKFAKSCKMPQESSLSISLKDKATAP